MSRKNRKKKKRIQLCVRKNHASGISKALWPARIHAGIATGRAAQRRRMIALRCMWCIDLLGILRLSAHRIHLFSRRTIFVYAMRAATVLLVTALMVLSRFYDWPLPVFLAIVFITALVAVVVVIVAIPDGQEEQPLVQARSLHPPMHQVFPDTPMPDTPLIRVLETINLLQSPSELFQSPFQPPSESPLEEGAHTTNMTVHEE